MENHPIVFAGFYLFSLWFSAPKSQNHYTDSVRFGGWGVKNLKPQAVGIDCAKRNYKQRSAAAKRALDPKELDDRRW